MHSLQEHRTISEGQDVSADERHLPNPESLRGAPIVRSTLSGFANVRRWLPLGGTGDGQTHSFSDIGEKPSSFCILLHEIGTRTARFAHFFKLAELS